MLAHFLTGLGKDRSSARFLWLLLLSGAQDAVGDRAVCVQAYSINFVYLRLDFADELWGFV